jgi:hypothetical protein
MFACWGKYQTIFCNDADPTTEDTCNPSTGCVYTKIVGCNDGNQCTLDQETENGCTNQPITGIICNGGACLDGVCTAGRYTCDDYNACTGDFSDTGCSYMAMTCNDYNPMTVDSCDVKKGCVYTTRDSDSDGSDDLADNCVNDPNPDQNNVDSDALGDVCDQDIDGDGIGNADDNCRYIENPSQQDIDSDSKGDFCDPDKDGDGFLNGDDNCPSDTNQDQLDTDGDDYGDVCDTYCSSDSECADDNACTTDYCDGGECKKEAVSCYQINACEQGVCDPQTGCVYSALVCDDQDQSTEDSCDTALGCVFSPIGSEIPEFSAIAAGIALIGAMGLYLANRK